MTPSIVILKPDVESFEHGSVTFKPRRFYRCLNEDGEPQYLVNGEWFRETVFNKKFEDAHKFFLRAFNELDVIKDGKPISKTAFAKLLDVHQYGRTSQSGLKIAYLNFRGRENIIGFYPAFKGETKKQTIEDAYEMFVETVNGNMDFVDCQRVQIGNAGVPISYGDLRNR